MLEVTSPHSALKRFPAFGLALLSGLMLALSFPIYGMWPLAWLGLVPFLYAIRGRGLWGGAWVGWVTGTVTTSIGFSWIGDLLATHAFLPWPLAVLGLLVSGIAHGAPMAATGLLTCWLWKHNLSPVISLPLSLTAAELLVPVVFPWLLAVSQQDLLLFIQIADIIGARGLSTLVALGGAAIFVLMEGPSDRTSRKTFLYVACIMVAVNLYGGIRLLQIGAERHTAQPLRVGLVQPHLSLAEKHDVGRREINLALHQDMSAELEGRGAEIVIWPESSYPFYIPRSATSDHSGARAIRRGFQIPVIFGALSVDEERRRFNSAFLVTAEGRLVGGADKQELLIFGEHVPFYDDIPMLQQLFPNVWNFTRGEGPGVLVDGSIRVAILNCYEDILPECARRSTSASPNLLVNITNDTWFGDTAEPHQHAASARFRAIEHRVDLIRAVNSGVSTLIASTGEVIHRTPVFIRRADIVVARLTEAGTIYTALGDTPSWLMVFVIPLLVLLQRRRMKPQPPASSRMPIA